MERYIGLDAHASSCTLGVVSPSGKRLSHQAVETNAQAVVGAIGAIAGRPLTCAWRRGRCPAGCTRCFRRTSGSW